MPINSVNPEVRMRFVGTVDLGSDPCVVRLESAILQARPVSPNHGVEVLASCGIYFKIHGRLIGQVGVKPGPAAEVERVVNAQRAGRRWGIDQPPERRRTVNSEVAPFSQVQSWDFTWRITFDKSGGRLSVQSASDYERTGFNRRWHPPAGPHREATVLVRGRTQEWRAHSQSAAERLDFARQRQHVAM